MLDKGLKRVVCRTVILKTHVQHSVGLILTIWLVNSFFSQQMLFDLKRPVAASEDGQRGAEMHLSMELIIEIKARMQ